MAKGYFPYHLLVASDFPINDKVHPDSGMYTRGFFHYRYWDHLVAQNGRATDRVAEWIVWSGFDRNKSSRKSGFKLVDETLSHEQGHLDISELHSRRFAHTSLDKLPIGEGPGPEEASADLRAKMQAMADRVGEEAQKEQDLYDTETAHGKNASKQLEWSAAIHARLGRAGIHF
jgi:hypothetical protein